MGNHRAPENRPRSAAPRPEPKPPEGRRFQPGVSGNPGGRPKGLARAVRERLTEAAGKGSDGADVLVEFWSSIVADKQLALHSALRGVLGRHGIPSIP